jgi:ATP/maltotriose-dependent transcriptional regulator MalT
LDGAGHLAHDQGDDGEAIGLLETSLSYAKEVGATSSSAIAAAHLCAARKGFDPRAALAEGEEAVALAREAEDDYVLAVALNNLGDLTRLLGETERATAYHEESLELRRRLGDRSRIALSLGNVAEMALLGGDLGRATALFAEAAETASVIGDKRHVCFALNGLAWVAYLERRWEEADAHARESLRLSTELGMKVLVVEELFCLSGIAAATGDVARAARLAAAAELHNSLLAPEPTLADAGFHQTDIESARAACDPQTWERAWAAGRAMSLDEAAEHALSFA